MSRVKVNAVKMVVRMPSTRVTAKPRIGPDPRPNRTTPAISVVTLESKMVPNAMRKPVSIDPITERPSFISSRIRS